MRKEIVGNDKVFIGRLADTDVREFAFDLSEYVSCMDGEFSVSCLFVLPSRSDSEAYAIAIDHYRLEGSQLIWIPTNAECSETGWGKFEAILYNEGQQIASLIWRVQVGKSLVGDEEPPEGWENYILAVERLVDEIEDMTATASVDNTTGTPSVTVTKTEDPLNLDFAFHNLKGAKGDKGDTGSKGETGNGIVSIVKTGTSGLVDTYTITYDNGDTDTFTVTNGEKGDKGDKGNTGATPDIYTTAVTLAEGSSAYAHVSGTIEQPLITFGIPKGDTGAQPPLSDDLPLMDGTASAGTDTEASRSDHVHPSDTTKEDKGKMTNTVSGYRGGTVAWNQLIQNGDFSDGTTGWETLGLYSSLSVVDGWLVLTHTGQSNRGYGIKASNVITNANHKYLLTGFLKKTMTDDDADAKVVILTNGTTQKTWTNVTEDTVITLDSIYDFNASGTVIAFSFGGAISSSASNESMMELKDIQLIDLTQMFGSTIADYIYTLETNTPGDGVAWFRQYFPLDYYPYDSGTLKSVDAVNYSLFGYPRYTLNTALRGIPKLDADNNLTYDADSEENGTVNRKYTEVTITGENVVGGGTSSTGIKYIRASMSNNGLDNMNKISNRYLPTTSAPNESGYFRTLYNVMYIYDNAFTDEETAIQLLNANPLQAVYEASTPTTESVTSTPVSLTIPPYPPNGDYNLVYEDGTLQWVDMQSYINQRVAELQALILEG